MNDNKCYNYCHHSFPVIKKCIFRVFLRIWIDGKHGLCNGLHGEGSSLFDEHDFIAGVNFCTNNFSAKQVWYKLPLYWLYRVESVDVLQSGDGTLQ